MYGSVYGTGCGCPIALPNPTAGLAAVPADTNRSSSSAIPAGDAARVRHLLGAASSAETTWG
eukprot:3937903-Rhodomonas_salina.1